MNMDLPAATFHELGDEADDTADGNKKKPALKKPPPKAQAAEV